MAAPDRDELAKRLLALWYPDNPVPGLLRFLVCLGDGPLELLRAADKDRGEQAFLRALQYVELADRTFERNKTHFSGTDDAAVHRYHVGTAAKCIAGVWL